MKKIKTSSYLKKLVIAVAISIPLFLALSSLFYGHLTFWYDPARDLQTAWNNLSKPTLIGPTSGIPGLFYGPYWIWLLSAGLLVSKDPIIVTFITATLPYFIILPLIWFRFAKFFGLKAVIIGWLLFMLSTGLTYATQLWNPYPAPLFTLGVMYLLLSIDFRKVSKRTLILTLLAGFLIGLVINFHISFGIAFSFGIGIFLVWTIINDLLDKKTSLLSMFYQKALLCLTLGAGVFLAYIPTLLFELRHNFQQIQVLLHTLSQYGAVIQVKGLSKPFILQEFNTTLGDLLHLPNFIALFVLLVLIGTFVWQVKKKQIKLTVVDKKIITLLVSVFAGVAFLYLTARNAVWEYHFISVEIFYLLLVVFLLSKLPLFTKVFVAWTVYVTVVSLWTIFSSYLHPSYFQSQKAIVTTIAADAKDKPYVVAAYTNATYNHETTYMFRWLINKDVPADPNQTPREDVVYIIVPTKQDIKIQDFVNYRTPHAEYKTVNSWKANDNITVLKRVRK